MSLTHGPAFDLERYRSRLLHTFLVTGPRPLRRDRGPPIHPSDAFPPRPPALRSSLRPTCPLVGGTEVPGQPCPLP